MHIQLIQVPYDSGQRSVRMGRGPEYFVQHGAAERLQARGWSVEVESIEAQRSFRAEIYTTFELDRQLAGRVSAAREKGALPLVLAGNCDSCLGTIAGLDPARLGIIWFDAHGDFNTPETTTGGFLDGMALATAVGRCWPKLAQSIPGFVPIPEERTLMIGVRELDPEEEVLLEQSQVTLVRGEQIRAHGLTESMIQPLSELRTRVQRVYVHIDLDALDTQVGRANSYAVPGGLLLDEMKEALSLIAQRFEIAGAAFTAYDPECDPEGGILRAGCELMEHMMAQVSA